MGSEGCEEAIGVGPLAMREEEAPFLVTDSPGDRPKLDPGEGPSPQGTGHRVVKLTWPVVGWRNSSVT